MTNKQLDNGVECPKCGKPMENLGNVSGVVMTSNPPCWDEVWVCRKDKTKKTVRVSGGYFSSGPSLEGYTEVNGMVSSGWDATVGFSNPPTPPPLSKEVK